MKLNRDLIYITIIVCLIAALSQLYYSLVWQPNWQEAKNREVSIYYSREVAANELVIDQIHQADKYVYFAIYTFTREDIKDALIAAKLRGLDVHGLIDRKQSMELEPQAKIVAELQGAGIPIEFNDHSAIMHLKTLVTDKSFVSGSYNWTASATERNDEVLEIGRDEKLRRSYQKLLETLLRKYSY